MSFLADQELVGRILSFAGLFLAPFCSLFARHYSRSLYFMQFLYIVNMLFKPSTTTTMTISSYLNYSFLDFIPEITSGFCMTGDFACTYGKLVTAAIVWLAAAVFFFLLIKIVACKKRNAKFLSFYNWFKGIMYWFYGPLVYAAVSVLIPFVEASSFSSNNFYASAIVVIAFLGIALVELIAYKVAQREEENIWKKWIQFFSHFLVGGTVTLMAVYTALPSLQDTVKYLIPNLFTVLFSVAYLFNYKFSAKVVERILMLAQDIVIIATLNLFVFKYDLIVEKDIDFYAIAVVLIIEILETLIKFIMFCKNNGDGDMDASVAPEKEGRENNKRPSNSFGDSFNEMNPEIAQNSRNDLRNSQVYNQSPSPKRGRAPRR